MDELDEIDAYNTDLMHIAVDWENGEDTAVDAHDRALNRRLNRKADLGLSYALGM